MAQQVWPALRVQMEPQALQDLMALQVLKARQVMTEQPALQE